MGLDKAGFESRAISVFPADSPHCAMSSTLWEERGEVALLGLESKVKGGEWDGLDAGPILVRVL